MDDSKSCFYSPVNFMLTREGTVLFYKIEHILFSKLCKFSFNFNC